MTRTFYLRCLLLVLCLGGAGRLRAQLPGEGAISAHSHSGQFIVQGRQVTSLPATLVSLSTNRNYIFLEPTILTVSSERVKQIVWRELGLTGAWKGKIYLELVPSRSPFDRVEITASRFTDGWQYRLQLPSMIDRGRYMRGLVQVVLTEIANRQNTSDRLAEVPVWLCEGLAQHLVASDGLELIIQPPRLSQSDRPPFALASGNRDNPLEFAHKQLAKSGTTLSFEELCWPSSNAYDGANGADYRCSAQVFFCALGRLQDGRTGLKNFVESIPRFYNWQLAFFNSFKGYFERPLDVEKWWSLQLLQFTGRQLGHTWARDESLLKLKEALRVSVKVYENTNALPDRAELSIQEALARLETQDQTSALITRKIRELELVHLRIAPELSFLPAEYRAALQAYLQEQPLSKTSPKSVPVKPGQRRSIRNLADRLDLLDQRLNQEASLTVAAPGSKGVAGDAAGNGTLR